MADVSQIGIAILAGGKSVRMGRDKAKLPLAGRPMLSRIRRVALATKRAVRVIRRDLIPGYGPIGGIHAALRTSRAEAELFLACDMPFVSVGLLNRVSSLLGAKQRAVFSLWEGNTAGFPCIIRVAALPMIERQIASGRYSLQELAEALGSRQWPVPRQYCNQGLNINTPADWKQALARLEAI